MKNTFWAAIVLVGCQGCEPRESPPFMGPPASTWEGQINTPESVRALNPEAGSSAAAVGSASGKAAAAGSAGAASAALGSPSGYFFLSKERLAELRAGHKPPAWQSFVDNVNLAAKQPEKEDVSAENVALAYLLAREQKLADLAFKLFKIRAKTELKGGSYLEFGNLMQGAAVVFNYCYDALSAAQRKELVDYMEKGADELWFHNKGSGWGLADSGNNYYCAFVQGTAFIAYAFQQAKIPTARKWIDLVHGKIEGPKGALSYFAGEGRGGNWHEGANYGERSKQRYYAAFAAIASMGGPNYFAKTPFILESIYYAIYQVQPGRKYLAPDGDLARDSAMDVTPFDRDYIQLAAHWVTDDAARGLAAWYLREVAPSFMMDNIRDFGGIWHDVIFPSAGPPTPPDKLPLHYRSQGTQWVNARSSWSDSAMSLTFNGTPEITQSHAHVDPGAFVIWRGGWQAVDATSFSTSGLHQGAGAHNMIQVAGKGVQGSGKSRGMVHFEDDDKILYSQIDSSNLFARRLPDDSHETLLEEWTRELVYLRPDVLVVYDRVVPKPNGKDWSWRLHLPRKPAAGNSSKTRFSSAHDRGSLTVDILDGGETKVAEDNDLEGGPTKAWRVEVLPNNTGRVLAAIRVGGTTAPNVFSEAITAPAVQGAASGDFAVVFSSQAFGRPAPLPFTYKAKRQEKRTHVIANLAPGAVDVALTNEGGFTVVKVSSGTKYKVDPQGVVRFSE